MNVEIGTEATQFPEKEYRNGIFVEMQGSSTGHLFYTPCIKLADFECMLSRTPDF
jgi:hypothetical protein